MTDTNNSERTTLYFKYRGNLTAALGNKDSLVFVSNHVEGQATALYRAHLDRGELSRDPAPTGMLSLIQDGEQIFASGADGNLYQGNLQKGGLSPLTNSPGTPASALALLSGDRLAALCGAEIRIYSRKDGALLQQFSPGEKASALASDQSGVWLGVGTASGGLVLYNCEKSDEFQESGSGQIHDGAVTALMFERGENRIYSAGADLRFFVTHVRGELEPEERGGDNNHKKAVTQLLPISNERFYSAAQDGNVKRWAMGYNKKRPATSPDISGAINAIAPVELKGKAHLAIICDDNSIHIHALDEDGRVGDRSLAIYDAYAFARHEFKSSNAAQRDAALVELSTYKDNKSMKLIADRTLKDDDHALRLKATKLLGESNNPRAVKHLETLLENKDPALQIAAFQSLRLYEGESSLRPMILILKYESTKSKGAPGIEALKALEKLAGVDDQALTELLAALNNPCLPVRLEALNCLERVLSGDGPEAFLFGLKSQHADLRLEALWKLYERKLLETPEATQALRKQSEDPDGNVRKRAFEVAMLSRPNLAATLRSLDPGIHRNLYELENPKSKTESDKTDDDVVAGEIPPAPAFDQSLLTTEDFRPLLEAMGSRALDVSLMGSTALALLKDARALGSLLQLSREDDEEIRITVCKALRKLADHRSLGRLRMMLHDKSPRVCDAACSALFTLEKDTPFSAIEAAFNTQDENIRHRGLQLLLSLFKAGRKEEAQPFFERALNDPSLKISRETFKAIIFGGEPGAEIDQEKLQTDLRFCLGSSHSEIRNDVMTEVRAHSKQPWAFGFLLGFLQDLDPGLRKSAFDLAVQKYPSDLFKILRATLESPYVDTRRLAAEKLRDSSMAERPLEDSRELILICLEDEKKEIRELMTEALIQLNAEAELIQALESKFADVRLSAACARAKYGDERTLDTLLESVTAKEPDKKDKNHELWRTNLLQALSGLQELAHPQSFDALLKLVQGDKTDFHQGAAHGLANICDPARLKDLRGLLSHTSSVVKKEAALGLAFLGNSSGASLLLSSGNRESMLAALCMGAEKEDYLLSLLDGGDQEIREIAFLLALLLEKAELNPAPKRLLAGLSSSLPQVRLSSAVALKSYAHKNEFSAFVLEHANARGDKQLPWKLSDETVDTLSQALAFGAPRLRVYAFRKGLTVLFAYKQKEKGQKAFEHLWDIFAGRFAPELQEIKSSGGSAPQGDETYTPENLQNLAFGAYTGLSRLAGGGEETRVRQTALTRIRDLALRDESMLPQVTSVLLPAIHDSNEAVRKQVFDSLVELKVGADVIAGEAVASGFLDMGGAGLKLLAQQPDAPETLAVLEHVFKTDTSGLENTAAEILSGLRGKNKILVQGLEVRSPELRKKSVSELGAILSPDSEAGEQEKQDAGQALRSALDSRYSDVVRAGVTRLVQLKDTVAFETIVKMLAADDPKEQKNAIKNLVTLGDSRSPVALLNRLEKDPADSALKEEILEAVGVFRDPESLPALFIYLGKKKTKKASFNALLKISAYDQKLKDEEKPDWEKDTYPRNDEVLARFMGIVYQLGDGGLLNKLVEKARIARGSETEALLNSLTRYPRDEVRNNAVTALGWRLEFRKGSVDALLKALEHKDGMTRFIAAEGLARGGRKDGLNILLTAVDLMESESDRARAVNALGLLADEKALDTLLRLANDEYHVLAPHAVEALGHMKDSPQSVQIFEILSRMSQGDSNMTIFALSGLRWFNSRSGWEIIRNSFTHRNWSTRCRVAELLAFDPEPEGRVRLETMIRKDNDDDVVDAAADSLREICGEGSLEPVYSFLQSRYFNQIDNAREDFYRLGREGDPGRLLQLLPKIYNKENRDTAIFLLLSRTPPPFKEAGLALADPGMATRNAAAHILGRADADALSEEILKSIAGGLGDSWKIWREDLEAGRQKKDRKDLSELCRKLIWVCGKFEIGQEILLDIIEHEKPEARFLRQEALLSISRAKVIPGTLERLEKTADSSDTKIRGAAAACLSQLAPERTLSLLEKLSYDGPAFNRLADIEKTDASLEFLRKASIGAHTQGIALPHLINRGDSAGLKELLQEKDLTPETRLGLIEGLGAVGDDDALAELRVMIEKAELEEERKTAYRVLHRALRRAAKASAGTAVAQDVEKEA